MVQAAIANASYTYIHDDRGPLQALDTHHIVVRRNAAMGFILYLSGLLLVANPFLLLLNKDKSISILLWSLLVLALLIKLLFWKPVEKESVVIMPTFGVQLETHYGSGRKIRRFIPMSKILKPVLNECVTPVTCYWSLSLIVRGEKELALVFKELHPPMKMLVPIWKALCAAADCRENVA